MIPNSLIVLQQEMLNLIALIPMYNIHGALLANSQ
jgi:hypothetical protein